MSEAERDFTEPFLNILGYQDDEGWVALALEMDLRGYGSTFDEAVRDLKDLVMAQISFARFKGEPGMIWYPADPIWFERFAAARQDRLSRLFSTSDEAHGGFRALGMSIPPAHVIANLESDFEQANA